MTKRLAFMAKAISVEGSPYIWGAKGPDEFDCSGLVTWCLLQVCGIDWRAFHNCAKLWTVLPPTSMPVPGDLVFYERKGRIEHVMVLMDGGKVYGAVGGGKDCTTVAIAKELTACVKYRSKVHYRPGFAGYRRFIPLDEGDFRAS